MIYFNTQLYGDKGGAIKGGIKHKEPEIEKCRNYTLESDLKCANPTVDVHSLYLKEMEFRYNHRNKDLFKIVEDNIKNLVPNLLYSPNFLMGGRREMA